MYPYHNKIKQRIRQGELVKFTYVEEYNNIRPALLLYFKTEPYIRPIRQHRFEEYEQLFAEVNATSTEKQLLKVLTKTTSA